MHCIASCGYGFKSAMWNVLTPESIVTRCYRVCGKRRRKDINQFQINLAENIYQLHQDLKNKTYTHSSYQHFKINDPKPRNIHKASVRDRLLHHAIYHQLYPYFDTKFIHNSYSCRKNKGTHKALKQFKKYYNKVSRNNKNLLDIEV